MAIPEKSSVPSFDASLRRGSVGQLHVQQSKNRTIFTAGRPPWYDTKGDSSIVPLIIGITGGSASGKTTVAKRIIEELGVPWVCLLSMDSFYKVLDEQQLELAHSNNFNFDHPDAFDLDLIAVTLEKLKQGHKVDVPIYDFTTHARKAQTITMYGANVIIFEGILSFATQRLRDLMDLKIFVDEDADVRLARRLRRDIRERGRDLAGAMAQYDRFVKPAFEQHIQPTMQYADLVVPRGASNTVAMDLIIRHVRNQLAQRGLTLRAELCTLVHEGAPLPTNVLVLPETKQLRALFTIIRNRETKRDDFVYYSERIMRLLLEHAIAQLPHRDVTVETEGGAPYKGLACTDEICGVSVMRAGMTLESSLRRVVRDVPLGKILIQTNDETNEPELHFLRLPPRIDTKNVIVMDATVASGAAAMMAIRVLLDHDVPPQNIIFVCLISAPTGLHALSYAFPQVKVVTGAVDRTLNEHFFIVPGIGNFGDRYFGTE